MQTGGEWAPEVLKQNEAARRSNGGGDRRTGMKKYNILVTGNDGKKFYQNFHVIEVESEAAKTYLLENFPNPKLKPTIQVTEIEEMEDAELFLPGVIYKSGKAYFNQDEPPKT
jgi:hypothetical protein